MTCATEILRSYLLLPTKKGVENRRFSRSKAANARRIAELHSRHDGRTLSHEQCKYSATAGKGAPVMGAPGAGYLSI